MASTALPWQRPGAGLDRPGLVAVPDGVLVLDRWPLWSGRATAKLVVGSLLALGAIYTVSLVAGPSGSALALVGMLWLAPWLALTAGSSLLRKTRTCGELLRHRLRRAAAGRWLREGEGLRGSPAAAAGGWVRVRGRVLEGPGFVSASGRADCVLACYSGWVGRDQPEARAEVQVVSSCLVLVGAEVVEVALDGAVFVEQSLRLSSRRQEQTIAVGDEIQAVGYLLRVIDQQGRQQGGGYRRPGFKLLLRGSDGRPVILASPGCVST
jgi:hypothetical protein